MSSERILAGTMGNKEDIVMGWYCLVTFASASTLFGIRRLLLRDASNYRISRAADYVPVVEVRVLLLLFFLCLSRCDFDMLTTTLQKRVDSVSDLDFIPDAWYLQ